MVLISQLRKGAGRRNPGGSPVAACTVQTPVLGTCFIKKQGITYMVAPVRSGLDQPYTAAV